MDVFKQNRNLLIVIVVLIILNLTTLTLLWIGRPAHNIGERPGIPGENQSHIQKVLKEELNFTEAQAEQYIALRESHQKKIAQLVEAIKKIKKEMFDKVLLENSADISDSLLNLSLEKQAQLERITFNHFQDLKKICNKDQQKKLIKLMHNILGPPQPQRIDSPPPPGANNDNFPPPPRREGSPIPEQ